MSPPEDPFRPASLCRGLLHAMDASEGRRRRRARDTTPDAIGFDLRRRLLRDAIDADPAPADFESFLLAWVTADPAPGPARAIALDVFDEWRLARSSPAFASWLAAGAPSDDASPPTPDAHALPSQASAGVRTRIDRPVGNGGASP